MKKKGEDMTETEDAKYYAKEDAKMRMASAIDDYIRLCRDAGFDDTYIMDEIQDEISLKP